MTGLFRRLARQVVGPQPSRLRPLAGLPFSPVPAFLDEPSSDASPASIAPKRPDRAQFPKAGGSIVPAPLASVENAHDMGRSPPNLDMRNQRFGFADNGRRSTQAREPAAPARANPDTPDLASREGTAPVEPLQHAATDIASAHGADSASSSGAVSDQGFPAALVNGKEGTFETRFPESASHHRPSPTQLQDHVAARNEPVTDEVHVHIGRIEITAIQETPRNKHRRQQGARPSELDAYLARRAREQS